MPMTCYCKKCGRDVPVGDTCAHCGAKLARSSARVAWCVEHAPVRDWMCWNAVMRILLPVAALALLLTLLLEGLIGGAEGVETLLRSGLTQALALLLVTVTAAVLLIFILQGEDWLDCVVDSKGIHVSCYLPNPTPLKLMLRLRSPRLMQQLDYGKGYQYAHDYKDKLTAMQCLPDSLVGREYYHPTEEGLEGRFKTRLETIKAWKKEHGGK